MNWMRYLVSFEVAPDVLYRTFGNEAVLLHLESERYYSLNESAARMWELLTGGRSAQETASAVASEFDASEEVVLADLTALLDGLLSARLVVQHP